MRSISSSLETFRFQDEDLNEDDIDLSFGALSL